ncbi:MAG: diacylglycerol kinase family protein [Mediterranea sp.]|jgi:diacylglycerol kinase (ATP)|nr:diacylglycerol kinase family protein [Mediterranea sp.]
MGKLYNIKERLKSFVYAGKGIYILIRREHNAGIHCAAIALVTTAGFYFNITKTEWIAIILCFGLVLAVEALNTAIERLVDMVCPERRPLAGEVKDLAAAVLICAITATIVGAIVFIPYF